MRSVDGAGSPDDRTARARIRDAAIGLFAGSGVARTSVRAIAAAAGVSPALVIHHFGSKEALRVACDRHVADRVVAQKRAAIAAGSGMDLGEALRRLGDEPPLLRYLARTLAEATPEAADLVDLLVSEATAYTVDAERAGMVRPSEDPHARAVVLALWSLGALVLHEHLERLLGVDLVADGPAALGYVRPVLEIYGRGVLTEEAYASLRAQAAPDPRKDRA